MSGQAPQQYSSNPSTIKARRRKMSLSGVKRVEEAARTADYKAMIYVRKVCQTRPEYQAASDSERAAILERSMRETMEKRRAKGQDTLSKVAAYKTGDPRALRAGAASPSTHVRISRFLETNGFVPARGAADGIGDSRENQVRPASPLAPVPGPNDSFSLPTGKRDDSKSDERHRSSSDLFMCSSADHETKPSATVAPWTYLDPKPLKPIKENVQDEVTALRNEVSALRDMCHKVLSNSSSVGTGEIHEYGIQRLHAEVGDDSKSINSLQDRLSRLEGVVGAIQIRSVPSLTQRVAMLEELADNIKIKVGSGCDFEVAKMREVFSSLRETLNRVGTNL
ncbi:unnamed protein product [Discula destructiva]